MAVKESYAGKINRKLNKKLHVIDVAAGRVPADLVLKNAHLRQRVLQRAVPRGHRRGGGAHCGHGRIPRQGGEATYPARSCCRASSTPIFTWRAPWSAPRSLPRLFCPHGTTTVITDPHEIANVMGTDGIEYMLQATEDLPVDVRFMLPSCVPATPLDESGPIWTTGPSTPSMTIPGSRAWRR